MFMLLSLGSKKEAKKYVVSSMSLSLDSRGEYEKLDDCQPGEISLNVLIDPSEEKDPGKIFYDFAADQDSKNVKELTGQIEVFKSRGEGKKGKGQTFQKIEFNHAWISNLMTSFGSDEANINMSLNIMAGEIITAGQKFKNDDRYEWVENNNGSS